MVSADVKSDEEDTREGNDGLEGRERDSSAVQCPAKSSLLYYVHI